MSRRGGGGWGGLGNTLQRFGGHATHLYEYITFFLQYIQLYSQSFEYQPRPIGRFIKDEYCSWVQYKSGPGGGPSM